MSDLRVLHVDDDPDFTRLVGAILSRAGFAVTPLNDPEQVISRVVSDNFRVVILDMDMPVLDGLHLLEDIKRHDGGVQAIMLTGIVTATVALEAMRLGANDCLFKPLQDKNQLVAAVQDSFSRIDRWRNRLRELAERRKLERQLHACP